MKGFHFRLETVLALRKHREETLQGELAESQRILDAEMAELTRINDEMRERARMRNSRPASGPLDIEMARLEGSYLDLLKKRRLQQLARIEEQSDRVTQVRNTLLDASRDKKALETYRERTLLSFTQGVAKKEQERVDEVSGVLHHLRHLGGASE